MIKRHIRKIALLNVLFIAVTLIPFSATAEQYRTLKEGDYGSDVIRLKTRMYYLGYFTSLNFSDTYNKTTVERIKLLQKKNGLKQSGIATPELQELIFSDECVYQAPTPKPETTPTPAVQDSGKDGVPWPEMDTEGFLVSAQAPFVYENTDDGFWAYVSKDIHVEIQRFEDRSITLVWFETSISLKKNQKLCSFLVPGKKKSTFRQPADILSQYENVVLAFSDDFFGYRTRYEGKNEGIIIRDSQIIAESTVKATSKKFPPLEILALFADGSMKTFESNEKTATEYLDMGVTDTFAFGPILVQNGGINENIKTYDKTKREPRTALGMIEPRKYLVITALGRRTNSKGASIAWLAEKMQERGAVEALNLDGGNTCSLIFNGKLINRPANVRKSDIRYVSGLIGLIEEE